jgi:hypothetical protein
MGEKAVSKPEYNTQRPPLQIREYGRNIHKLIEQMKQIEDRRKRTRRAYQIVNYMATLNPDVKDTPEQRQKLWDHLFIIAGFELDVDAPYPIPDPQKLRSKPNKLAYPGTRIKYRNYGKYVEKMIETLIQMKEGEEKQRYVNMIAGYMKHIFRRFSNQKVTDEVIIKNLEDLSGGKLKPTEIVQLYHQTDTKPPQGRQNKPKGKKSRSQNIKPSAQKKKKKR